MRLNYCEMLQMSDYGYTNVYIPHVFSPPACTVALQYSLRLQRF